MKWKKICRNMLYINGALILSVFGMRFYGAGQPDYNNEQKAAEVVGQMDVQQEEEEHENKKIALTFDDGPHPHYTQILLDGLKERDVKATFFIVGKNIEGNEAIIKRMHEDGHAIGNHTYDHINLAGLTEAEACAQVEKVNEMIYNITGEYPEYLRPPFGNWNDSFECAQDMMLILWNIDSRDWTTNNSDEIVTKVEKNAKDNGVILLHDWYKNSVTAALRIVDILQAEGYDFVSVDEIYLN